MRGPALETLVTSVETSLNNVAEHASATGVPHPDRLKRHAWAMRAYLTLRKAWERGEAAASHTLKGGSTRGSTGTEDGERDAESPLSSPSKADEAVAEEATELEAAEAEDFETDDEEDYSYDEAVARRSRRDASLLARGLLPKSHQGLWAILLEDLCPLLSSSHQ